MARKIAIALDVGPLCYFAGKRRAFDITVKVPRIQANNTPPATRKISALRGVTRFWGLQNSLVGLS